MERNLIFVALVTILTSSICMEQTLVAAGTDLSLVCGAIGKDVVEGVIKNKIAILEERSPSLLPNNRLMRRIAKVETDDGTAPRTYSDPGYHGGIWRVDSDMFDITIQMFNHIKYSELFGSISTEFNISWANTIWENCRKPLYSALAARLFLHNASPVIPPGWALQLQAEYWGAHYQHDPPTGTLDYFIDKISEIPGCNTSAIDLVFVMDGSGSVGATNFDTSKSFAQRVVDFFVIGTKRTRVGVIQYSSGVRTEFHLKDHTDNMSLQTAISNITYIGGGTQTERALFVMADESFLEENGARPYGIPRVAMVITDGRSQGANRVRVPADQAREMDITIFAIGVTSSVVEAELNAIANEPNDTYVFHVDNFNAISRIGATIQDSTCDQPVILKPSFAAQINVTVSEYQTQTYQQTITQNGTTLSIQATEGSVVMYGSVTISHPNSALNDFSLTAHEGQGPAYIFIGPELFDNGDDGVGRRRRQVANETETDDDSGPIGTVYITIEGKQATNAFSLVTVEGDVTVKVDVTTQLDTTVTTSPLPPVAATTPRNGCDTATPKGILSAMMLMYAVCIAWLAL